MLDTSSDNQEMAVICGPVSNVVYRELSPNTIGSVIETGTKRSTDLLKLQWHIPFCTYSIEELSKAHHLQAHRGGGGGGGGGAGDISPGPPNLFEKRGSMRLLNYLLFLSFWAAPSHCFIFFQFPLHCLDSMSECLGRIIGNAFSKGWLV